MWEDEYEAGDRVVLHLEPGLAFGTGTHETTRLCMELLEKYVKPGDTMLDMGLRQRYFVRRRSAARRRQRRWRRY